MTWGLQNNQHDADQQIQYALERQINFIDTAEMYAVPPSPETYGKTEAIIGDWIRRHPSQRQNLIVATKIAGPGLSWVREGSPMSAKSVQLAVEASLQRLQTDYIDLYQLHWPNRTSPHFAKHWPNMIDFSDTNTDEQNAQMLDILHGLDLCVKAGKIRYCGLSDETPWGISQYLKLAQQHNLPKMVSIQNEFSLLHSKDWPYLIEQCVHEDIAYLPWSALAGGALTGKYLAGARPTGSRWTLVQRNGLFRDTAQSQQAIAAYVELAKQHAITPAQLALAWCKQVHGVTSTIIGATNLQQLQENIDAFELTLSDECLGAINHLLQQNPQPF
jgi:aryl-alcohol dehydrogenase-like predicted oxidoreductase